MSKPRLARVTSKNQITLPKEVMDHFPNTDYFEVRDSGGMISLLPVRVPTDEQRVAAREHLEVVRDHISKLGITEQDVDDAVAWARKNRAK